jgi:uncharacterized protein YdeI (BOF family)
MKYTITALMIFAFLAGIPRADAEMNKNPYSMASGTWITIRGVVKGVRPDTFTLDYGDNSVIVEMDDGDRDADAYQLIAGDKVSVSGRIDDDFFERTTIEAAAVYVENLNTTFFSSAIDEEDRPGLAIAVSTPMLMTQTLVNGIVTRIKGSEFVVDTGMRALRIETDELAYDPLDDQGYQKIQIGDRVRVTGRVQNDFFDGREIVADSITELDQSPAI